MPNMRKDLEAQALQQFQQMALKHGYKPYKKQGINNRIRMEGNLYFQFGDLRVTTPTHHIVVEAESSGGVSNLVKYWYCLEKGLIDKTVFLVHVYRQSSPHDYQSHLSLWDFLWDRMKASLGKRMVAFRYKYRDLEHLRVALRKFEELLVVGGETEIRDKPNIQKPEGTISPLSDVEIQRRKALVKHMLKMRDELPPLDMTTAELVRLAREERNWFYGN